MQQMKHQCTGQLGACCQQSWWALNKELGSQLPWSAQRHPVKPLATTKVPLPWSSYAGECSIAPSYKETSKRIAWNPGKPTHLEHWLAQASHERISPCLLQCAFLFCWFCTPGTKFATVENCISITWYKSNAASNIQAWHPGTADSLGYLHCV